MTLAGEAVEVDGVAAEGAELPDAEDDSFVGDRDSLSRCSASKLSRSHSLVC